MDVDASGVAVSVVITGAFHMTAACGVALKIFVHLDITERGLKNNIQNMKTIVGKFCFAGESEGFDLIIIFKGNSTYAIAPDRGTGREGGVVKIIFGEGSNFIFYLTKNGITFMRNRIIVTTGCPGKTIIDKEDYFGGFTCDGRINGVFAGISTAAVTGKNIVDGWY